LLLPLLAVESLRMGGERDMMIQKETSRFCCNLLT
jgi:hypothetical protein